MCKSIAIEMGGVSRYLSKVQKNPRVHKIFVRNFGAGNGCANFMGASKKCVLSAGKTHVDKIPPFRGGGGYFGLWGGGECRLYFYGREDFSDFNIFNHPHPLKSLGKKGKTLEKARNSSPQLQADCGYSDSISQMHTPCKHFRALSVPALQSLKSIRVRGRFDSPDLIGGEKVYTKGVFSSENSSASACKKEV